MESTDLQDKIALNPADSADMAEFFSRKEPGDEVTGTFKATLDEAGEKIIVLSIAEISIDQGEGEDPIVSKTDSDEDEEDGGDDEEAEGESPEGKSAAVAVIKNEGVPVQEDDQPEQPNSR